MFKTRSNHKELLDAEDIPEKDLEINLKELHVINKRLGGYSVTINALKKIITPGKDLVLVDIGCGGGDTLKEIARYFQDPHLRLFGIDIKPYCIEYSRRNTKARGITFIC